MPKPLGINPDGSLIVPMDTEGRFRQCCFDNEATAADMARMFWVMHGSGASPLAIANIYGTDEIVVMTIVAAMDRKFGKYEDPR